ncbi:uncharacterized protein [Ptychodera flava]|uniref:uncharacterized protein n=1 Tax=Ptychodera flava TaxID=63121 RepID=UPI00396A825A
MGGEENRQFVKSNFQGSPLDSNYISPNLVDPSKTIIHVQDFSHDVKKLRNSVMSSGHEKGQHTRLLTYEGKEITWEHFKNAVLWDRDVNSRPIYYRISDTHLAPNKAEKMRNHLAEDMLNKEMLHLMEVYQSCLPDGSHLESTIAFLTQTSTLIAIFRDRRPVTSMTDDRLEALKSVHQWFTNWRYRVKSDESVVQGKRAKLLPSTECLDDLDSLVLGFLAVCEKHLSSFPGSHVVPARFNSDVVENHFCQERGLHNGNLTHPNYYTYCATVNAVILGQTSISRGRKSNAGLSVAKPYKFYVDNKNNKRINRDR